jgi:GT2 family glycosyltransferase
VEAEIVVVDNASTDNTSAIVKEWAASSAFPVNVLFERKQGLAAARNCALRAVQGDLIVWTDDDCRLSKDYVTDLLRHDSADTEPVLRGGRVELGDPTDLPLTIKTELVTKRWSRNMDSARRDYLDYCIGGCNMAMRRAAAGQIGYFDERFGAGSYLPACEDTDYIYRAYLAGIVIEYVPDMVVFHHHGRKSISEGRKLFQIYMIGLGGLYAKYIFNNPVLCRPFYRDIKLTVRGIISGKNKYNFIGFSYKRMVACNLLGAARYFAGLVRGAS